MSKNDRIARELAKHCMNACQQFSDRDRYSNAQILGADVSAEDDGVVVQAWIVTRCASYEATWVITHDQIEFDECRSSIVERWCADRKCQSCREDRAA